MNLYIAYILSLISMPIVASIVGVLFFPLLTYLRKFNAELLYWIEGVISTIFSYFAVVYISKYIFSWLVVDYSILSVLVLFAFLAIHNIGRLIYYYRTDQFMMELSYTVGDTLGFLAGALYFIYSVHFKIVSIIFIIPVLILLYLLLQTKQKSFPFWQLATKVPDTAYDWFTIESCWVIYDPKGGYDSKPDKKDYVGPFRLSVPCLGGRIISIYGQINNIEDSQKRFIEKYSSLITT